ncbi:HpcH/HpaI aldolase/citrate lyase family protein [Desulfovermiculus halophilus]|jgi:citrate lyase beta subunit|uniref:HpcH/HpaI aldolase/citrate lyase family protein n=1 Tax=Desulfovermiculus halophilus TaxID=339722 RepID=UPI0005589D22|nr:CoA ester lyase [Desulfovermiculus halophilus]
MNVIRLRRSVLSVPANKERMVHKAMGLNADEIMLDLEDSVPVQDKEGARRAAIACFQEADFGPKVRACRINDMQTPYAYRDIIDIVEQAGTSVDVLVVPKVAGPAHVSAIDLVLSQIETALNLTRKIGIEACIETAEGLSQAEAIAASSDRVEALVFGVADFTASMGAPPIGVSGHGEGETGQGRWYSVLCRLAVAAKANGLQVIDAPYGDHSDPEGLFASCRLSSGLGFDGKWAIHPSQLETINTEFSPSPERVEQARRVVAAYEQAAGGHSGSLAMEGKMVDAASVRLARSVVDKWEQMHGSRN